MGLRARSFVQMPGLFATSAVRFRGISWDSPWDLAGSPWGYADILGDFAWHSVGSRRTIGDGMVKPQDATGSHRIARVHTPPRGFPPGVTRHPAEFGRDYVHRNIRDILCDSGPPESDGNPIHATLQP